MDGWTGLAVSGILKVFCRDRQTAEYKQRVGRVSVPPCGIHLFSSRRRIFLLCYIFIVVAVAAAALSTELDCTSTR